jgi:hypothetical protein
VTVTPVSGSATPASSSASSSRAEPMSGRRSRGSRCRHRPNRRRTDAGVSAGSRDQSGSVVTTAAIRSVIVSPGNSGAPVSNSNSTTPNAHTSARRSTVRPRICSGDMYPAVPRIIPATVPLDASVGDRDGSPDRTPLARSPAHAFASPKSRTFAVPAAVTFTLAGFRCGEWRPARAPPPTPRPSAWRCRARPASGGGRDGAAR